WLVEIRSPGYEVLRATVDGEFSVLASLEANSAKFSDNAVQRGVTYQYKVRAVLDDTIGPESSTVEVTSH
ncbi:MAG: hypothetical protein M1608_02640, partial [Candidatus Omnitrophica bacterium]|nr:hypothetical protein [Candidatus Omnitrophota bacterium]